MNALVSGGTWDLVLSPTNVVVGCHWVYTLKYNPYGLLNRYKARLVAKGYTQTYDIDYFETFSPVARMNFIRILFSVDVNLSLPSFQLDIKNAFLYGDLQEEVYMEQQSDYVAHEENKVYRLKKGWPQTVHGHDLRSSALLSLALVFTGVTHITLSSSDA